MSGKIKSSNLTKKNQVFPALFLLRKPDINLTKQLKLKDLTNHP